MVHCHKTDAYFRDEFVFPGHRGTAWGINQVPEPRRDQAYEEKRPFPQAAGQDGPTANHTSETPEAAG